MSKDENKAGTFENAAVRLVIRTLIVGLVAAVVAGAYSRTLPNRYSARCALLLAPLTIKPEQPGRVAPPKTPASDFSYLMVKPLSVADYEILLMNDEIVDKVRTKLKAVLGESREEEPHIRLEDVRSAMGIKTRILARTSYSVEYQPVIELTYTSTSPEIAAGLVNEWARLGVELATNLATKADEGSIDFLEKRFEDISTKLEDKEKELEAVKSKWDIDTRKERLLGMNTFLSEYEYEVIKLDGEIADTEAQLLKVRKDLETVPEKYTLRKAPPDEAYWMLEAGKETPDSSKVLASETVNELYLTLRELEVTLQSTLAGMQEKREVARKQVEHYKGEITEFEKLQAENLRRQTALEREVETYGLQFVQVADNYEAAQVAEAETPPDLKLAYSAAVPEKKVAPHRSLIVFVAAFIGILIVPLHFAVASALRTYGKYLDAGLPGNKG